MDDTTVNWKWCIDSETGEEWLINLETNEKIISREELDEHPNS